VLLLSAQQLGIASKAGCGECIAGRTRHRPTHGDGKARDLLRGELTNERPVLWKRRGRVSPASPLAIRQLPSLICWLSPVALATCVLGRWPSAKGRQASFRRGLRHTTKCLNIARHKAKPAIDQRRLATASIVTIADWGLGRLLWHPFGLKLKASYHVHGPSPPTNGSRGFSRAKAHLVGDVGNSMAANQSAIVTDLPAWSRQSDCLVSRWTV